MVLSEIQELIDYLKFKSITSKSKAKANDAEKLADEINQSWWNKNKDKIKSNDKRKCNKVI